MDPFHELCRRKTVISARVEQNNFCSLMDSCGLFSPQTVDTLIWACIHGVVGQIIYEYICLDLIIVGSRIDILKVLILLITY